MLFIGMTTYHTKNIKSALKRLKRFGTCDFSLFIHNDNPKEALAETISDKELDDLHDANSKCQRIISFEVKNNLGILLSRFNLISGILVYLDNIKYKIQDDDWFIFMDDDDVLLDLDIWKGPDMIIHKFGVSEDKETSNLLYGGTKIDDLPKWEDGYPKGFHRELGYWHTGGQPIRLKVLIEFYEYITELKFPVIGNLVQKLKEKPHSILTETMNAYGTTRIFDKDDVILCHLLHKFFDIKKYKMENSPIYSYVCIADEPRLGRYNVEKGVPDTRYGGVKIGDNTIKKQIDEIWENHHIPF